MNPLRVELLHLGAWNSVVNVGALKAAEAKAPATPSEEAVRDLNPVATPLTLTSVKLRHNAHT